LLETKRRKEEEEEEEEEKRNKKKEEKDTTEKGDVCECVRMRPSVNETRKKDGV